MKYIKARKDIALIVGPLLLLIGILLFCFCPQHVLTFFNVFWLCCALAIFLIITPYGNKRLQNKAISGTAPLRWSYWFFSILLLEITLIGLYLGISNIAGNLFLVNTTLHPTLFLVSTKTELLHFGLFPWSLYAIIAVGMGVLAYCEQTDAFFSELIKPIAKLETDHPISLIINVGMRRIILFGAGVTIMFMVLLLISLFLPVETSVVHGFYPPALLMTLFLLLILFTQKTKQFIARLFSRRVPAMLIYPAITILLGFAVLILSAITYQITKQTPVAAPPTLIDTWIRYHWDTAWTIFSVMWWCSLTPVVSAFITRISRGYSIRSILIGTLILPALMSFFFVAHPSIITALTFSPFLIKLFSLLSFFILFPTLINHTNSSMSILSYFPKSGVIKYRDEHAFFQRIAQFTILALYFYLVIGINGLSLFIFAPNYFTILALLISSVAIVKNVLMRRSEHQ